MTIKKLRKRGFIKFILFLSFFILDTFGAYAAEGAEVGVAQIKKWIVEKRVQDAVSELKKNHEKIIQSVEDRKKIHQWLGAFVFEETLNHYSKAIELQNQQPEEALSHYKSATELEPQNWKLHGAYISLLMDLGHYPVAQELIETKLREQPYVVIYGLYQKHLKLIQTKKMPISLTCSVKEYFDIALTYCRYLKLIIFSKQNAHSNQEAEKTLEHLTKNLEMPDVFFWRWHLTKRAEDLHQYLKICAGRDQWTKQHKEYKLIPGVCANLDEAKAAYEKSAANDAKKN